jgi:translation initiation factor IF-1
MNSISAVLNATVVAELPQRLYRLETEDGTTIIAGESPQARRLGLGIKAGDKVRVRRAQHDVGRGTILERVSGMSK